MVSVVMAVLSVAILLVNAVESALNANVILTSDVVAFNLMAVFSVVVLLANIKSLCDFVYTSAELAFNPVDVLSVATLLVNVVEFAFNAMAVLRVL